MAWRTNQCDVSFDNLRVTGSPSSYNTLVYLHGDHLGSIGAVTNSSGALLAMTRFLPFGGYRDSDPAFLTESAFTGHKMNNRASNDLGLIYMGARFYVPYINRFISADVIVPQEFPVDAADRRFPRDDVPGAGSAVTAGSADGNPTNEIQAVQTGINTVYQSVVNGVTRYIGITNDFARRAAEHADKGRIIQKIPGLDQLSRNDARAVEQVLINHHQLSKLGGTLENAINSIAQNNPIYPKALQRGLEILTKTGNLPQ